MSSIPFPFDEWSHQFSWVLASALKLADFQWPCTKLIQESSFSRKPWFISNIWGSIEGWPGILDISTRNHPGLFLHQHCRMYLGDKSKSRLTSYQTGPAHIRIEIKDACSQWTIENLFLVSTYNSFDWNWWGCMQEIKCYIHKLHAGWIGFSHACLWPNLSPHSLVLLSKRPKPAASGKWLTSLKIKVC